MAIIDFKATKCRHCYKCVRYCEVKAIMVKDGRAEIIPENCILCGRCLQICPQSAKTLVSDLELVKGMLRRGEKCARVCIYNRHWKRGSITIIRKRRIGKPLFG